MKKFDNYIIEKPCDSNSDKLQKILIIESLVDDILQFSLRINNSVGEIFLLQPFQKKTIFIPCYFEEDIVKVNSAYYVVKQTTPRLKDNQKEEIFKKVSNKIFEIIEKCKQDKTAHLKGKQIKKYYLGFRKEDNDKEKVKCENKTDFIELKT